MGKKVLIIGAGIGGITTAIKLAKKGFDVSVYEKNAWPGGRCGRITRQGHRFDLGATIFLMPSIYRKVFESMDLKLEDCFDFKNIESLYHIFFDDGSVLDFTSDFKRMESQLEALEPGSFRKMKSYITEGYRFLEMAMDELLGRNFYHLFDFVTLKNVGLLVRLKTWQTHHSYIKRFFRHPHLRMAFTFQNIYVGQSPFNAPALFAMLPAAEITEGSMFPDGGMSRVSEKLVEIAMQHGVSFYYEKPVTRIIIENKRATGLMFEDESTVNGDIVVANADLPFVYNSLLPDRRVSARIERLNYSSSAIVFHWGLDKKISGLSHHNVFLSDDYRNCLDTIFKHKSLSERPCFYVHAPVFADPDAAPDGEDTFSVVVPVAHLDARSGQDWDLIREIARNGVIARLKELGITDLEKHIKFEICYSPETWESRFNVFKGATFGSLSHSIMQMGYFRPHNRHNRYHNLYFTGGSTHPGNGVPLVLLSAKLTSERILKENPLN